MWRYINVTSHNMRSDTLCGGTLNPNHNFIINISCNSTYSKSHPPCKLSYMAEWLHLTIPFQMLTKQTEARRYQYGWCNEQRLNIDECLPFCSYEYYVMEGTKNIG